MKRLDEIIEILEEGNKPLDEVVTMYEEGIRLSKTCMEYLDQTELRIKKLVKDAGGKFNVEGDDE
jgi:exodeoxyribonuclease VII small subunit